jgi:hypothetical protein
MMIPFRASAEVPGSTIPVKPQIEDVALGVSGTLQGAIVDNSGKPIRGASVVIAQAGKVLQEAKTNQEGRFEFSGVRQGVYQVASHAQAQNYRTWQPEGAPPHAKKGVVHVMPEELVRGGEPVFGGGGLSSIVTHPLLIAGVVVTTAVVIGAVALSDDDDAS